MHWWRTCSFIIALYTAHKSFKPPYISPFLYILKQNPEFFRHKWYKWLYSEYIFSVWIPGALFISLLTAFMQYRLPLFSVTESCIQTFFSKIYKASYFLSYYLENSVMNGSGAQQQLPKLGQFMLPGVTSYTMFPSQAKLGCVPQNVGHSLLAVDRNDAAVGKHPKQSHRRSATSTWPGSSNCPKCTVCKTRLTWGT